MIWRQRSGDERKGAAVVGAGQRGEPISRLRLGVYAFVAAVLIAGLLAGAATGAFATLGRSALYLTGVYRDGGSPTIPPHFFDTSAAPPSSTSSTTSSTSSSPSSSPSSATPRGPQDPVLPDRPKGRNPRSGPLRDRVAAINDDGIGTPSWVVANPSTGSTITAVRGGTPMIPASALKLVTGTAALDAYGPDHRFTTKVVSASATRVVLVGGGDPYLASRRSSDVYPARANLDDLADQVAKALRTAGAPAGRTRTLDWDASLFTGPAWNPTWPATYSDQAAPTSALWVDGARLGTGSPGPRQANPARSAAAALVEKLEDRGLKVELGEPARAPRSARALATARSMPLAQIVEEMLMRSDNDAAEVLFRQVAVADRRPGSIVEGRKAIQRRLTALGAWTDQAVVHDGSGLSRANRITPATFVTVLELALSEEHPQFRSLATGLPVAGSDGSLRYRFFAEGTQPGRGQVHAKTGTLSGVHALVGYATTADGAVVSIVFVVNSATSDYNARTWLDRAAAAVARCGC